MYEITITMTQPIDISNFEIDDEMALLVAKKNYFSTWNRTFSSMKHNSNA